MINKTCTRCGIEKPIQLFTIQKRNKSGYGEQCKACISEQSADCRIRFKQMCVDYLGGKCELCGYNKSLNAMDFHHRDPNQKDFNVGAVRSKIKEFDIFVKPELDKCQLLCGNCHREVHFNEKM